MANHSEHLNQAVKNIDFLEKVNTNIPESWDWQVTISFYSALHLANAHIAHTINQHYRTHGKVSEALNAYLAVNPSMFNEEAYLSYLALQGLSRRSRYLCSDKDDPISKADIRVHFTSEKHLAKALRHLNNIQKFFSLTYKYEFSPIYIGCSKLKEDSLEYISCK
ncbi:hypothetical protein [Cytophaga aurantiaca]|uniref:hypothetical protein n=1 Tax=Cytophaga aurantiaca TaxID=29530 RepID=UPI00037C4CB8|nr:hypothetical protein [Cytophaga aurantiaca]